MYFKGWNKYTFAGRSHLFWKHTCNLMVKNNTTCEMSGGRFHCSPVRLYSVTSLSRSLPGEHVTYFAVFLCIWGKSFSFLISLPLFSAFPFLLTRPSISPATCYNTIRGGCTAALAISDSGDEISLGCFVCRRETSRPASLHRLQDKWIWKVQ